MDNRPASLPTYSRFRTALVSLGAVLGGLALGLLMVVLLATQVLGYEMLVVRSNSMQPALNRGDLIVVRPQTSLDIGVGDIAVFEHGNETPVLIAHRVVGVINGTVNIIDQSSGTTTQQQVRHLRTQGDANAAIDVQTVDPSRVRGTMWFAIPGVGNPIVDWHFQKVFLFVMVVVAAVWVAYEASRFVRRRTANLAGRHTGDPVSDAGESAG